MVTLVSKVQQEAVIEIAGSSTESSGESPPVRVGSVLAERFELIARRDGEAGADVYEARDRRSGEAVLVRILEQAPAETRARFIADVARIAKITHPCIAQIIAHGVDGAALHYVTDPGDGVTVAATLAKSGAISPEDAVKIATAALSGLHAAHKVGVFHGDLRPEHIVLAKRERNLDPRVIHFGLALPLSLKKPPVLVKKTMQGLGDPSSQVPTSASFGTLAYAAPEQVEKGVIDARSDVYGLAATLYEMLSGVPPFAGGAAEVRERVLAGKVPSLLARAPKAGIPEALDYAVRRGMSVDPAERPATAADFAAMLWQSLAEARRGVRLAPRRDSEMETPIAGIPIPIWRARSALPLALLGLAAVVLLGWFLGRGTKPSGSAGAAATAPSSNAVVTPPAIASAAETAADPGAQPPVVNAAAPLPSTQPARPPATRADTSAVTRPTSTSYKIDDLKEPFR